MCRTWTLLFTVLAWRQIGERFIWHTLQPLLVTQLLHWKTWRRTLQTSRLHAAQETPNTKQGQISQLHQREEVDTTAIRDIKTAAYVCLFSRISQLASSSPPLYRRNRLLPALHTDCLKFIPPSDCDIIPRKQRYQFTSQTIHHDADKLL